MFHIKKKKIVIPNLHEPRGLVMKIIYVFIILHTVESIILSALSWA